MKWWTKTWRKTCFVQGEIEENNLCFCFWLKICSLVISCNIQGQTHGNKNVRRFGWWIRLDIWRLCFSHFLACTGRKKSQLTELHCRTNLLVNVWTVSLSTCCTSNYINDSIYGQHYSLLSWKQSNPELHRVPKIIPLPLSKQKDGPESASSIYLFGALPTANSFRDLKWP